MIFSKTETIEALRGAVRKWQDVSDGRKADRGLRDCPLCQLSPDCFDCPVYHETLKDACRDTPYADWDAYWAWGRSFLDLELGRVVDCDEAYKLAVAELEYLKGLLAKWESGNEDH